MSWRIWVFYCAMLVLLLTSVKPIWWLPLASLTLLVLSFPPKVKSVAPNWHDWHPVFASLVSTPLSPNLSRWVRYGKITGGDWLILLPTRNGIGLLLLDLSKNDLDTFLHFIWARALLNFRWNHSKSQLLRLMEDIRQCSERVDLSYLIGFLDRNETEWQSVGCFGVGWFNIVTKGQQRILPTLGRTFWRTRRMGACWVFTTDGIAPYLSEVMETIIRDGSPESLIANLPRQDDLTVGWFVPKLKALISREIFIA